IGDLRVIGWRAGDVLARAVDLHSLGGDLLDHIDRDQHLRSADAEKSARCDLQETHFLLLVVDYQIVDMADLLAAGIDYLPTTNILLRMRQRQCSVAQTQESGLGHGLPPLLS